MPVADMRFIDGSRLSSDRAELPPSWYDRIIGVVVSILIGFSLVGMALAMLDFFLPGPVVALGFAASYSIYSVWFRFLRIGDPGGTAHQPALAALAIALLSLAWNGVLASESMLTDSEAGIFVNSGRALAIEGALEVDVAGDPFALGRTGFQDAAFELGDDGALRTRVPHLMTVLAATAAFFGVAPLLKAGALFGAFFLLTIFWVAARIVRPWLAVAVTAGMALSLPFMQLSRELSPEVVVGTLVFGAIGLIWGESRQLDPWRAGIAGLALGLAAAARPQWFILAIPVAVFVVTESLRSLDLPWQDGRKRRLFLVVLTAAYAAGAAVALADNVVNDVPFDSVIDGRRLAAIIVPVIVGAAVVRLTGRMAKADPRRAYADPSRALALVLGVLVAGAGLFALYGRPIERSAQPDPAVVSVETQEDVDIGRTYSDETAEWITWYQGNVATTLGLVGLGAMIALYGGTDDRRRHLFILIAVVASTVVLVDPGAPPVHISVMGRLLPITIPAILIAAAWAAERVGDWQPLRSVSPFVVGAMALVLVVPPLLPTSAAATAARHDGVRAGIDAICDAVGRDGAILINEPSDAENFGAVLAQPLRGFCQVPVARALDASDAEIGQLALAWEEAGRVLSVLESGTEGELMPIRWSALERTVRSAPDSVVEHRIDLTLTRR